MLFFSEKKRGDLMIYFNDLPETIIYQNEIAYQSKYYGYYATESGKCITLKVKADKVE